mmetsp:Transcript_31598/g.68324  ORF Transcript_31598/g.68324 Transcript_31598/m.68324 type:complete len:318 (-) Transcript_31598:674-1627(-)
MHRKGLRRIRLVLIPHLVDLLADAHIRVLLLPFQDRLLPLRLIQNLLAPLVGVLAQVVCRSGHIRLEEDTRARNFRVSLNDVVQGNGPGDLGRVLLVFGVPVVEVTLYRLRNQPLPKRVVGDRPHERIPNHVVLVVGEDGMHFRLKSDHALWLPHHFHQAVHRLEGLHVHVRVVTPVVVQNQIPENIRALGRHFEIRVKEVVLGVEGLDKVVALLVCPDLDFPVRVQHAPLELDLLEELRQVLQLGGLPSEVELLRNVLRRRHTAAASHRHVPQVVAPELLDHVVLLLLVEVLVEPSLLDEVVVLERLVKIRRAAQQ